MEAKDLLNCNSLMIGDWIRDGHVYAQVTSITCDGIIETTHSALSNIELVEPIPLTTEILEKNGFTKELENGSHYRFTLIDEHIKISILYARSVFQWLGPLDFKYVHELQHALRLCGIRKEIIV